MPSKKPFVSIIVATYNAAKTLEQCIQSIRVQSCSDYELIIIDGLSTDDTVSIIKNNQDVITTWISEKDGGIYDAWNKGVKRAKGEWISFIGADDTFYPDAIKDYASFIEKNNDKGLLEYVSSKMDLISPKNVIIKTFGLPWKWEKSRLKNTIAHPGSFHHSSLFSKYGLFNTNFRIVSDYEFLLRPGKNFNTLFMDKVTVRMAQGGISFNETLMFKEHYQAVITTGKLNVLIARYYFYLQVSKSIIKKALRKLGANI